MAESAIFFRHFRPCFEEIYNILFTIMDILLSLRNVLPIFSDIHRAVLELKHIDMKELKIGNLIAKIPIVQGGMGVGISLSGLASAVANAGGVGVISAAGLGVIYNNVSKNFNEASIHGLKQELKKAREATKKPC